MKLDPLFECPFILIEDFLSQDELKNLDLSLKKKQTYRKQKKNLRYEKIYGKDVQKSTLSYFRDKILSEKIFKAAQRSNKRNWKYKDLTQMKDLQLSTYLKNGFFDWHRDASLENQSRSRPERHLTAVFILNSLGDFRGGNLQIIDLFGRRHTVPIKNSGDLVLFPSVLPHRVTQIKRGRRISVVTWIKAKSTIRKRKNK